MRPVWHTQEILSPNWGSERDALKQRCQKQQGRKLVPRKAPYSPDITHRWPQVQGPMCEGTVQAILHTVAPCICFMDTCACLVVAQVVLALSVPSCSMQVGASGKQRGEHTDKFL